MILLQIVHQKVHWPSQLLLESDMTSRSLFALYKNVIDSFKFAFRRNEKTEKNRSPPFLITYQG